MTIKASEEMRTMREATGPTMEPLPVTAHLLQPVIERAARDIQDHLKKCRKTFLGYALAGPAELRSGEANV